MSVERVLLPSSEVLDALRRLTPQLTENRAPPEMQDLELLLASQWNVLAVARHPDERSPIAGAGALGVYRVPTGVRAVIEDIVVDASARGHGIGEAITRFLLEAARTIGAPGVSLTSNPRRLEANRLYLRMGFALRQTNSYFYTFR
ncbi:MAG TPA: GNAT family N-acetyltransferase [Anaerolineales bacterium]